MNLDPMLVRLLAGVFGLLVVASVAGWILARRATTERGRATVDNLNARTRAWWVMVAVVSFALFAGRVGTVILFGLLSFLALREFVTLTPTRRGDHRTLFWVFFVITPLQYLIVWKEWYGMFVLLIPVPRPVLDVAMPCLSASRLSIAAPPLIVTAPSVPDAAPRRTAMSA